MTSANQTPRHAGMAPSSAGLNDGMSSEELAALNASYSSFMPSKIDSITVALDCDNSSSPLQQVDLSSCNELDSIISEPTDNIKMEYEQDEANEEHAGSGSAKNDNNDMSSVSQIKSETKEGLIDELGGVAGASGSSTGENADIETISVGQIKTEIKQEPTDEMWVMM